MKKISWLTLFIIKLYLLILLLLFLVQSTFAGKNESECYELGPLDRISITVFGHPDLSTKTEVSSEGNITFPLLGIVNVKDMCQQDLQKSIKAMLEKDYLRSAEVSVDILERLSKSVTILGKVAKPGKYSLAQPSRLIDIISMAGGVSMVGVRKILVIRNAENKTESADILKTNQRNIIFIDYKNLFEDADFSLNIPIKNRDIINVLDPSTGKFYITGEVKRSGVYNLVEGLTIMKAITLAGGTTKLASEKKIYILRVIDGKEEKVSADPKTLVQEDDIIFVPESFF